MRAPVFTRPLEGRQYIDPNVSHVLHCDVTGLPLPQVTWYKDGRRLREQDWNGTISFNANKTR